MSHLNSVLGGERKKGMVVDCRIKKISSADEVLLMLMLMLLTVSMLYGGKNDKRREDLARFVM